MIQMGTDELIYYVLGYGSQHTYSCFYIDPTLQMFFCEDITIVLSVLDRY